MATACEPGLRSSVESLSRPSFRNRKFPYGISLRTIIQYPLRRFGYELRRAGVNYPEVTPRERALMREFGPYTMTPEARQWSVLKAVDYVDRRGIPGDIVECGVWRGGLMMLAKAACRRPDRLFYLYDTFAGMTAPTGRDVAAGGRPAEAEYRASLNGDHCDWCYASIEDVRASFRRHDLLDDRVLFRKGRVEDTLVSEPLPERIAILRLDTDWYASTRIELETLYPLLSPGGVLIIDDYGTWAGQTAAVDEYFGADLPLLTPLDWAARVAIKA